MRNFCDLQVLSLQQIGDQVVDFLAWDNLRVHEEELQIDRGQAVFKHEKVSIGIKELGDLECLKLIDKPILELDVDGRGELVRLSAHSHDCLMLDRVQVPEATRASCIHHHLVDLLRGVRPVQNHSLVLQILRICCTRCRCRTSRN